MGAAEPDYSVVWAPQTGPQTALLSCPVFEALYGGARGGGKTDGMLGEWAQHAQKHGVDAIGAFFRRELTQLDEAIERSKTLYTPLGANWVDQKKQWVFPNGARLKFRYLEHDGDAEAYQGHSYTRVYFEELTNFPEAAPVMKLKATLRSAKGVPCRFRATANPGGPGHQWVKARYIDPAPRGFKRLIDKDVDGIELDRVFIPARLSDNKKLTENDPSYVARLRQSGSETLVKAWLDGNWDIVEGAYFDCWSKAMILRPAELPVFWARFRSFDWGSAKPFSVGWWAIASDDWEHPDGKMIPKNSLIRYREWYGVQKKQNGEVIPNTGLKLTAEEVAQGIKERSTEAVSYGVADPSIFSENGGPSISERMGRFAKIIWKAADNKRVAGKGHVGGWDQMRQRMKGEDGKPLIYCFSTCADSIRTIPSLQHDDTVPEDLDSDGEDHAADDWRYACMSRIIASRAQLQPAKRDRWNKSEDDEESRAIL